jgi:hypothetical protein
MSTDYILFIHGVSNRSKTEKPSYADGLFQDIEKRVEPPLTVEKIALYWGNVNLAAENKLEDALKASKAWDKLWFKDFRDKQLLQFVGDAALYLSRHVGSQVVALLKQQAEQVLGTAASPKHKPGDRLHLVTHSWGTVILLDILFADRWEDEKIPGHKDVMAIRNALFGLGANPNQGITLASIHTMGSPIALFSLISVNGSSHDFQPQFNKLLENLYRRRGRELPWLNFIHSGDPVAWPLEKVMSGLVDGDAKYLDFKDQLTHEKFDFLIQPFSQTILALLNGGKAHGSYWSSKEVAQSIAQIIKTAAKPANS